ncbi:MAG: superoxide dismutase [Angelakisella sp.]|nr:superoxide dismutase [Angelakisella sp.]
MNEHYPFVNMPLPYDYDALEPYIDTKTMHLHHDKHLQSYVDNLNNAVKERPGLQMLTLPQLIQTAGRLPVKLGTAVAHNAGGVYNHQFYFEGLTPDKEDEPARILMREIDKTWDSFEQFVKEMNAAAMSVFGSGYAWLVLDANGRLRIITTANQETPLTMGLCPILNVDVWEHAYYLKHYNKRADYLADWLQVVNWPKAEERYLYCWRDTLKK